MPGFRQNAKDFYGTGGFHVPAQLTPESMRTLASSASSPPGCGNGRAVRSRVCACADILVRELTWDDLTVKVVLVSDTDQTVTIQQPNGKAEPCVLKAGVETKLKLQTY